MVAYQNTSHFDFNSLVIDLPFTSTIVALISCRYCFHYYQRGTFKQFSHVTFNRAIDENLYNGIAAYWQNYHDPDYKNAAIIYFSQPHNGNYDQDIIRYFAKSIIDIAEEPENHYFIPSYTKNMFATAFSADAFKYIWQFFDVSAITKEITDYIINIFDSSYQYIVKFANDLRLKYYGINTEDIKRYYYTIPLTLDRGYIEHTNIKEFCTFFNYTYTTYRHSLYREEKQWIKKFILDLLQDPKVDICIKKVFLSISKDLLSNSINKQEQILLQIAIAETYKEIIKRTDKEEKASFIASYFKDCYKNSSPEMLVVFYYTIYGENKSDQLREEISICSPDLYQSLLHGLDDSRNKGEFELNMLLSIAYLDFINDIINYDIPQDESEKSKVLTAKIILSALQKTFFH